MTRDEVEWHDLFFTRCDFFCDLLQQTQTGKCYLFVLCNKNSSGLLKDFGGHLCVLGGTRYVKMKQLMKCTRKSRYCIILTSYFTEIPTQPVPILTIILNPGLNLISNNHPPRNFDNTQIHRHSVLNWKFGKLKQTENATGNSPQVSRILINNWIINEPELSMSIWSTRNSRVYT